jgi:saccharopine dehydrogenase-like NADP-dependent oxidoreductase
MITIGSGDMGAQVAALVVQSGQDQGDVARAERNAEQQLEDAAEQQQVEDMRAKADSAEIGAFVEGAAQVGAGCAGGMQTGGGLALSGAGKIGGGVFDGLAAHDDADATAALHAATHASRAVDDAAQAARDARKLESDALDFYRAYVEADGQAKNAALRRA